MKIFNNYDHIMFLFRGCFFSFSFRKLCLVAILGALLLMSISHIIQIVLSCSEDDLTGSEGSNKKNQLEYAHLVNTNDDEASGQFNDLCEEDRHR